MYNCHDAAGFCDYCVPSAVMKALLRLTRRDSSEVPGRFVAAGGLRALSLLLQHEISGVHHSKLASSVVSLLNIVLDSDIDSQDEVRKVGGLSVLSAMLLSLMRQGVADIYQLRVAVCKAVQAVVRDNPANKLAVREHGLFQPLMALLRQAAGRENEEVLDDNEQLTAAAIDTLAACLPGSRGNQEVILGLGGVELLVDLISRQGRSTDVRLAAVSALGSLAGTNPHIQAEVLSTQVLERMVQLADNQPSTRMAEAIALAMGSLLRNNPSGAKGAITAGAVPLLVKMFNTRPPCAATLAAAGVLQMLAAEDIDMQNEIASQGGLQTVADLVAAGGTGGTALVVQALALLSSLVAGNSFVKNLCRQSGLVPLLTAALLRSVGSDEVTVHVASALADLCQSNHGNQEALADEGATEAVTELLRGLVGQGAGLADTAARPAATEALLRLLGCLVEFNDTNKRLVREAGGITVVAHLILMAAEVADLSHLSRLHLLGAVGAACSCVAKLAQDCPANQERFGSHGDLAPALFRLLSLQDPAATLEAARALEFLAIRTDLHDRDEERSEFEADSITALVKVLHTRGSASHAHASFSTVSALAAAAAAASSAAGGSSFASPYGAAAAAAAAASGSSSGGSSASAMIRETAAIMTQIVQAATALTAPPPAPGAAASGGKGLRADSTIAVGRAGSPTLPRGGSKLPSVTASRPLGTFPSLAASISKLGIAGRGAATVDVGAPALDRLVADHANGLVMLNGATGASESVDHELWLRLAGQSAAAFRSVSAWISEGPWRPLKTQVSWILFLLAVKSASNRELITKLERTAVTPLAQQMDNAEASAAALMQLQEQDQPGKQQLLQLAPLSGSLPISTMAHDTRSLGNSLTSSVAHPSSGLLPPAPGSSRQPAPPLPPTRFGDPAPFVRRSTTMSDDGEDSEFYLMRQEVALMAGLGLGRAVQSAPAPLPHPVSESPSSPSAASEPPSSHRSSSAAGASRPPSGDGGGTDGAGGGGGGGESERDADECEAAAVAVAAAADMLFPLPGHESSAEEDRRAEAAAVSDVLSAMPEPSPAASDDGAADSAADESAAAPGSGSSADDEDPLPASAVSPARVPEDDEAFTAMSDGSIDLGVAGGGGVVGGDSSIDPGAAGGRGAGGGDGSIDSGPAGGGQDEGDGQAPSSSAHSIDLDSDDAPPQSLPAAAKAASEPVLAAEEEEEHAPVADAAPAPAGGAGAAEVEEVPPAYLAAPAAEEEEEAVVVAEPSVASIIDLAAALLAADGSAVHATAPAAAGAGASPPDSSASPAADAGPAVDANAAAAPEAAPPAGGDSLSASSSVAAPSDGGGGAAPAAASAAAEVASAAQFKAHPLSDPDPTAPLAEAPLEVALDAPPAEVGDDLPLV